MKGVFIGQIKYILQCCWNYRRIISIRKFYLFPISIFKKAWFTLKLSKLNIYKFCMQCPCKFFSETHLPFHCLWLLCFYGFFHHSCDTWACIHGVALGRYAWLDIFFSFTENKQVFWNPAVLIQRPHSCINSEDNQLWSSSKGA